jgi:flagellar hook-length control protein FliK
MPNSAFDNLPAISPISPPSHGLTKKSNSSDDAGFDQVLQRASDSSRTTNDRTNQSDSEPRPTDRTPDEPRERLEAARPKLKTKTADENNPVARKNDSRRDRTEASRTPGPTAKNQKNRPSRADDSSSVQNRDSESDKTTTADDAPEDDASDSQSASNPELAGTVTCAPNAGEDSTTGESSIDVQASIDDESVKSEAPGQDAAKTGAPANSQPAPPDPTTTVTVATTSEETNQQDADQSPERSSSVEIVQPVAGDDKKSQAAASKGNLQQPSIQVSQADSYAAAGATTANTNSGLSATNATAALKDASQKEDNSDAKAGEHAGSKSGENQGQSANLQTSVDASYAAAATAGVQMSSAIASAQSSASATSDQLIADDHHKNDDEVQSVTDVKRPAVADRSGAPTNADDAASNSPGQISANNRANNRTSGAQASAGPNTVDPARFVQRVARAFKAADEQGGEIRLRLNPPELGALKVEVAVRDGVMNARIEAETPQARSLLLEHLPALRERLADQQIKIDRFDVDLRQDSAGGGFANPSPDYGDQRFSGSAAQSSRRTSFSTGADQPAIVASAVANTVDGKINVIV